MKTEDIKSTEHVTLPTEEPAAKLKGDVLWLNTRVLAQLAQNKWAALTFDDVNNKLFLDGKEIKQSE